MGEIAKALDSTTGRRSTVPETDPKKVKKRISTARNHLRQLSNLASDLDVEDFNKIRDSLAPVIETFQKEYAKPKTAVKSN